MGNIQTIEIDNRLPTDKGSSGRTGRANFLLAPSRADFTRG